MSESSIDALIAEGHRIHSAATPGTWHAWDRGVGWLIALDPDGRTPLPEGGRTDLDRREDAEAIAWAHNHLPSLLDMLEQYREIARDRRDELVIARARIDELEAQRAAVLGHTIPRGGGEFTHDHSILEGHDGCPACWAEDIREALGATPPSP